MSDRPCARRTFGYADIEPFLYRNPNRGDSVASEIPNAHAVTGIDVVARKDGLFVFAIHIDASQNFDIDDDLDELAYVISMVVKSRLGHAHYHHNMPGKGRAKALKPSQVLAITPVRLQSPGLAAAISNGAFSDRELFAAMTHAPAGSASRQALVQLRYEYLKLDENVSFRVRNHRNNQAKSPWWARLLGAGLYAAIAGLFIVAPLFESIDWNSGWDVFALAAAVIVLGRGVQFTFRITTWDVPVVRLFRTAHGFFIKADELNNVLSAVTATQASGRTVGDFSNIVANLQSRIEGEQHRIQMSQGWLALCVALTSLIAALLAIQGPAAASARPVAPPVFEAAPPPAKTDGARKATAQTPPAQTATAPTEAQPQARPALQQGSEGGLRPDDRPRPPPSGETAGERG